MSERRRATGWRKTQNISLPPEDLHFAQAQAERWHGGNISRYIRSLIRRDQTDEAQRQRTEVGSWQPRR